MASKQSGTAERRAPPNAGKGRPKGSKNKTTASIKAALTEAFDRRGGVPALVTWAATNESDFYKLWARLAPTEVSATVVGALVIRVVREAKRGR